MKQALRKLLIFLVVLTMVIPAGRAYAATDDGTVPQEGDPAAEVTAEEEPVGSSDPEEIDPAAEVPAEEEPGGSTDLEAVDPAAEVPAEEETGGSSELEEIDPATLNVQKLGEIPDELQEGAVNANTSGIITREMLDNMSEEELDETVRVSIFFDTPAVLDKYTIENSDSFFAKRYRKSLESKQADVVDDINSAIGRDIDKKWEFTLAVNAVSTEMTYAEIGEILDIGGVSSVEIENEYVAFTDDTSTVNPNTSITSSEMTGAVSAWQNGYTGAGMRIAIIDTGIDLDHQSFDDEAFEYAISTLDEEVDLMTEEDIPDGLNGNGQYISSKIPYAYNYADENMEVTHLGDRQGYHGSHVAGIAAANRFVDTNGDGEYEDAASSVYAVGMAPDAQLIVMKVFGSNNQGANDSDYMAAIEDAIALGCDACNLSLGSSAAGFTYSTRYQSTFDRLSEDSRGMVVSISAGNAGNWSEYFSSYGANNMLFLDDVNVDTAGEPGSYINALSVASAENLGTTGRPLVFNGTLNAYPTESTSSGGAFSDIPGDYDFVYIDSVGYAEEYEAVDSAVDLEGKIVIINRGVLTFVEKGNNLIDYKPKGLVVSNNTAGTISMSLDDYTGTFPMASITLQDATAIKENSGEPTVVKDVEVPPYEGEPVPTHDVKVYTGKVHVEENVSTEIVTDSVEEAEMSAFSSWGIPGSLILKPEITAPGGNIYSVYGAHINQAGSPAGGNADYTLANGTSMAAPHIAGLSAVLLQYINEAGIKDLNTGLEDYTDRALAQSLLMSTASPMLDDYDCYYPVFQQGAGLADVSKAINAGSVLMIDDGVLTSETGAAGDGKVKVEFGDDPEKTGEYSYSFKLYNITDVDQEFELSTDMFTQDYDYDPELDNLLMAPYTVGVDADVEYIWDSSDAAEEHDVDLDGDTDEDDAQAILDYITGENDGSELDLEAGEMDEDDKLTSKDAQLLLSWLAKRGTGYILPAHGSAKVTVNITLNEDFEYYKNGAYVEGFTKAECITADEEGVDYSHVHTIPVLGFYGNWTDPSMFDKTSYYDALYDSVYADEVTYYNDLEVKPYTGHMTNMLALKYPGEAKESAFIGNPYAVEEDGFPEERLAMNSKTVMQRFYYNLIRPAGTLGYVIDALENGEAIGDPAYSVTGYYDEGPWYDEEERTTQNDSTKSAKVGLTPKDLKYKEGDSFRVGFYALPEYYPMIIYNAYASDYKDIIGGYWGTFALYGQDFLPDVIELGFTGKGACGGMEYDITVDDTAPVIKSAEFDPETSELKVEVEDNLNVAYVALMNPDGSAIAEDVYEYDEAVPAAHDAVVSLDASYAKELAPGYVAVFAGDYAGNEAAVAVNVNENPGTDPTIVSSVEVTPAEETVIAGLTAELQAEVLPMTAEDKTVIWTSSDDSIATVDENGIVTGVSEGTVTIRATASADETLFDECTVKVIVLAEELNAILYDENSEIYFASFKPNDPQNYTKLMEEPCDEPIESAFNYNGKIISGDLEDGADETQTVLFEVDQDDYSIGYYGNNAYFALDTAYGPTVEYQGEKIPLFAYAYGPYLMLGNAEPVMVEDGYYVTGDIFTYGTFQDTIGIEGSQYYTYLTGLALKEIDENGLPSYYFVDDYGRIWYTELGEDFEFTTPELIADTGIETDVTYQSLYYDGKYIYWSCCDKVVSELLIVDPETGEVISAGDFGDDVWPVEGLYEKDAIAGVPLSEYQTDSDASELDEDTYTRLMDEVSVLEVDKETIDSRIAAARSKKNTAAGGLNFAKPGKKTEEAYRTNNKAKARADQGEKVDTGSVEVLIKEDVDSTNGLVTVTYDPEKLTFVRASSDLEYNSIHVDEEKGEINFAYADVTAIDAETVLAALEFKAPCEDQELTVVTKERNDQLDLNETETGKIEGEGHDWGEPEYTWSDDNSEVTAKRVCKKDESHVETETVKTTSKVSKEATCETEGETVYTAAFENEAFEDQTKTVKTDAKGHNYELTGWKWSEDNTSATATFTCKDDPNHVVTVEATVTSAEGTGKDSGKTVYTATVTGPDGKTYTDVKTVDIPADEKGDTPSDEKGDTPDAKTGDTTIITPYIVIGAASLILLLMLIFRKKKQK